MQGSLGFANTTIKKKRKDGAIRSSLELFKLLLTDKYIMRRKSHDKKFEYCLYEGKSVPVRFIHKAAMKELYKLDLLRRKKDSWLVNRQNTRKLHGNSRYKKAYNKSK